VGLRFLGFSCLIGEGKKFAVRLLEQAEAARQGGAKLQAALALAEEAVRTRPGYVPAREALSRCLREAGRVGEAERLAAGVKTDTVPIVPAEARFSNGVRLLGISSLPSETRPGETFRIRYFWRCPRQVKASDLSVFVHFVASEIGFQDDHPFLEGQDTSYQPYPEVFVEERTVRVPAEASEGTYRLNVGLIDSRPPHRRYRVTSDLPQRLRAVTLPVDIHVRGGQEN
jgi:hypothetical protein